MSNLAYYLKQEIARLARKEIKVQTQSIKKACTQHRKDIANLKRTIQTLEKRLQKVETTAIKAKVKSGSSDSACSKASEETYRFSARSVKAQRKRIGFSAEEYGKLVGVTGQTIFMWERGNSRPRKSQLQTLVSLRGIGKREAKARLKAACDQLAGNKKTTPVTTPVRNKKKLAKKKT